MLNIIGKYISEICCVLLGFYLMGVILAFTDSNHLSFIEVLNSIGIFLSSVGVVVAISTVLHQQYLHKSKLTREQVDLANMLQYKFIFMIDIFLDIKKEIEQCNKTGSIGFLLDGVSEDFHTNINFDKLIFVSEFDSQLYGDANLAFLNYKRYINGIFIWQANKKHNTEDQNIIDLNDRIEQLEEFGGKTIKLQLQLFKLFKNSYPDETFYYSEAPENEFENIQRYTT